MLQSFAFRSPLLGRLSRRPAWNRQARDLTGLSPSGLRLQLVVSTHSLVDREGPLLLCAWQKVRGEHAVKIDITPVLRRASVQGDTNDC
jgi:hypothetical protein